MTSQPDSQSSPQAVKGTQSCCEDKHRQAVQLLGREGTKRLFLSVAAGLGATLVLLSFYFGALSLLSGWNFTVMQFELFWPYISALAVGFGIQMGLFIFLHQAVHAAAHTGNLVAVTGTTSGVAMISCCTHYLVSLLPALGATGLVSLVGQYQVEIFWFGIAANLSGIAFMIHRIRAFSHANGSARRIVSPPLS